MSSTAFSMPCFMLHRVDAGDDGLEAFVEDGFGEDGGGGGAVAGDVAGLAGDFADHAGAHVFIDVFQVDFLGDGDAVLGDGGRAEGLLEDDVAALGAEGDLDGAGELADAAANCFAGFLIEGDDFGHLGFSESCVLWGDAKRPGWAFPRGAWERGSRAHVDDRDQRLVLRARGLLSPRGWRGCRLLS